MKCTIKIWFREPFFPGPTGLLPMWRSAGRKRSVMSKIPGAAGSCCPPGAQVWCQQADNPARKTRFDLITVLKGDRLINMDSQAPNTAAREWLLGGGLGEITNLKAETVHGDSRFDFSFDLEGKRCFLEVKGVTLEENGICAFPDAPTDRGSKHLRGLTAALQEGYGAYVLFVIQMADVSFLHPNDQTDPAFGKALREAAAAGVRVLAVDCSVTPNSMTIGKAVEVRL